MTTLELLQKLHNGNFREERGELSCLTARYVKTCGGSSVKLDGDFDLDELKLIVLWMEEHQQ